MAKIKNTDGVKQWWGCENWNFYMLLAEEQNCTAPLAKGLAFSFEIKHYLPYDPAVSLLGVYPREMKPRPHKNLCVSAHSSVVRKPQKGSKQRPSTDEWAYKQQCVCTVGFRLAEKRRERLIHAATWMDLKSLCWVKEARLKYVLCDSICIRFCKVQMNSYPSGAAWEWSQG